MTKLNIKSLSPGGVRKMAAHFDDHIRNGMSADDQIAFLATYSHNFDNCDNHTPRTANPAIVALQSSMLIHRLFLPETLATLSDGTIANLYQLARTANVCDFTRPILSSLCRIIVGTFSLKAPVRALFAHFLMKPCDLHTVMPSKDPMFNARAIADEHEKQALNDNPFLREDIVTLRNYRKPEWMNCIDSIANGNTTAFRMGCSIAGKQITRNVIIALLLEAPGLLSDLILVGNTIEKAMSHKDLALHAIYHCKPANAETILSAINSKDPRLLGSLVDEFGNNLLWHRFYYDKREWDHIDFSSSAELHLSRFMASAGINPSHKNCYLLSWEDVMDARELIRKHRPAMSTVSI